MRARFRGIGSPSRRKKKGLMRTFDWIFVGCVAAIVVAVFVSSRNQPKGAIGEWFKKGGEDLRGRPFLMGLFALEFVILLGTVIPYIRFGCPKELHEYALFAIPCAAALAAGGGLFSLRDFLIDANIIAFIVSAVLLAGAYWIAISGANFQGKIWIWNILISIAACLVGIVLILLNKNPDLERFGIVFSILIITLGFFLCALGVVAYFSTTTIKCHA